MFVKPWNNPKKACHLEFEYVFIILNNCSKQWEPVMYIPIILYFIQNISILSYTEAPQQQLIYLSASEVSVRLADGQSWTMVGADGKKGRIRFDPNGTGAIEHPIKRKIQWSVDGNSFCMKLGSMLGTKCFQAVKTPDGFQGYSKGKPNVRFTR
jgi:hypothetical protein